MSRLFLSILVILRTKTAGQAAWLFDLWHPLAEAEGLLARIARGERVDRPHIEAVSRRLLTHVEVPNRLIILDIFSKFLQVFSKISEATSS